MSAVVTLENAALEVEPGASREAVVRIRNTGQIVDRFTIAVLGNASAWVTVSPTAVSLFPGAEETATVTFSPPKGSSPRAGRIPFGIRVRSSEDPTDSVVEEGSITVLPAAATTAAIVPQTSRGSRRGRHDVTITNLGNVPAEVAVQPADPDQLLSFDVRPSRLSLEPGARGAVRLGVRPNETFFLGPPQSKPFGVTIVSSGQAPFELRGTILQRALLPSWLPKVVAGVLVLALAGGVMAATVLRPPTPSASPGASVAQVSNPPASASVGPVSNPPESASVPPSAPASVTPSEPPTASPTASPTPPPPQLPPEVLTDCIGYDPATLALEDLGALGWRLNSSTSAMLLTDNFDDAQRVLALAQLNRQRCFIGRGNTRPDRSRYLVTFWTGDAGTIVAIPDGAIANADCLPYDPNNLTIEDLGALGWRLNSGPSAMVLADNEGDANLLRTMASDYSQQCFVGRGNSRPDRFSYIEDYWN